MKYRVAKTEDGYLNLVLTAEERFTTSKEALEEDLSASVGKPVTVIEADEDIRAGNLVPLPEAPPRELTLEERVEALESKLATSEVGIKAGVRE